MSPGSLKTSWKRRLFSELPSLEKRFRRELKNPRLINRGTSFQEYLNNVVNYTIEGFIINDIEISIVNDDEFDVVNQLLKNYLLDNFIDEVRERYIRWREK